jgi:electron transfer flavoprotein alpha/beta subunit
MMYLFDTRARFLPVSVLEQVSQIQEAMKQEMEAYRKEIDRLRLELLNQSVQAASLEEKTAEDVTLRSMTIVANVGSEKSLEKIWEHDFSTWR